MNLFDTSFGTLLKRYGPGAALWLRWRLRPYLAHADFYLADLQNSREVIEFERIQNHVSNMFARHLTFEITSKIWGFYRVGFLSKNADLEALVRKLMG